MPEPLVCEDTSLDRILQTVQDVPGARILYQDTVRRGGVLGFFAREVHRVVYTAEPATASTESAEAAPAISLDIAPDIAPVIPPVIAPVIASPLDAEFAESPIASLLASAEEAEARLRAGAPATDFASLLSQYVADADAEELPGAVDVASEPIVPSVPVSPRLVAEPAESLAEVTPLGFRGKEARHRLELLMQLRQVGVPVSLNPSGRVQSPYEALEDILAQLPAPADLPTGPGQLIVLAGEAAPAVRAARTVSRMLRLRLGSIVTAGVDGSLAGPLRRISSPTEAAMLRDELALAATPTVLVIATDGAGLGPDDGWPAEMLAALRPGVVWAVVDARWKTEDCQAQLARLPRVDALAVHSAELSASPASVWELDLPIGLLDERRPSTFIWLGMLIRLVGGTARHRATA